MILLRAPSKSILGSCPAAKLHLSQICLALFVSCPRSALNWGCQTKPKEVNLTRNSSTSLLKGKLAFPGPHCLNNKNQSKFDIFGKNTCLCRLVWRHRRPPVWILCYSLQLRSRTFGLIRREKMNKDGSKFRRNWIHGVTWHLNTCSSDKIQLGKILQLQHF